MNIILLIVLGLLGGGVVSTQTVAELDIKKYIGTWYQMYGDKIVYNTFEKDCYCVSAKYDMREDGSIGVHNHANIGGPNGTETVINGYAYVPDITEPGKLNLHFYSNKAPQGDASYWVLALGPVNKYNLYDWSIVSDKISTFLYVLARDVDNFNEIYKDEVLNKVKELGFTGRKEAIATYQEEDCIYG